MDNFSPESRTRLWEDYENGRAWQETSKLSKNLPTFVGFYEGRQWPPATPRTKSLPRPVVNITKMICRNKKSAILSAPVRVFYSSDDPTYDVEKLNKFAEYIRKEYGEEELDKRAVQDGVVKGTYVYHFYWDREARGKNGRREGALRCEIIDPLNVFFANPRETDEQKQKWILIASREEVESVKAAADEDCDTDLITSDESDDRYSTDEQQGSGLVTILTRYFRKDGEVFCEKATKSVIVNKPFPIAPDVEAARRELGFPDPANNNLPDDAKRADATPEIRAPLYPIVVGQYEPRENSIFGMGEVEGIIPNQKAINFNMAMLLLNVQEMAWGKYVAHPDALHDQVITNEPGQLLIDHTGTGQGIKKMSEPGSSAMPIQLIESLTSLTRAVTGSSEVMTGEVISSNMSGAAIAQLQSQAQQPVEELRDMFWIAKVKCGRIELQFYKLFYEQTPFVYDAEDGLGADGAVIPGGRVEGMFSSSEIAGREFAVVTEAAAGTRSTMAADINALDTLYGAGAISLKAYLKAYPDSAISNKSELLKSVESEEADAVKQMSAQIAALEGQLAESAKLLEKQRATVDDAVAAIRENNQLKAMIVELRTEAAQKINAANEEIKRVTADAKDFASAIYDTMSRGGEVRGFSEGLDLAAMRGGMQNAVPEMQDRDGNQGSGGNGV